MLKGVYNLLTLNTGAPIAVSSTDGVDTFAYPSIDASHASEGIMYVEIGSLSSPTGAGVSPKLWHSFNNASWFLQTALPTSDTAVSYSVHVDGLGKYLKASYATEVGNAVGGGVSVLRMKIELFEDGSPGYR